MAARKKREVIAHDPFADLAEPVEASRVDSTEEQVVETEIRADSEKVSDDVNAVDGAEIDLGESLTIQEVSEVMEKVGTVFDSGTHIKLKASDLERVDGAGVQLLCTLFKEASVKQVKITWETRSEAVAKAAMQLGMGDLLMLDAAA
jgi:anti-anti-sigma regulatory factor